MDMYFNVITFSNGKTFQFQSEKPFTVDELLDKSLTYVHNRTTVVDFCTVADAVNGNSVTFKTDSVITISSTKLNEVEKTDKEKRNVKVGRIVE